VLLNEAAFTESSFEVAPAIPIDELFSKAERLPSVLLKFIPIFFELIILEFLPVSIS